MYRLPPIDSKLDDKIHARVHRLFTLLSRMDDALVTVVTAVYGACDGGDEAMLTKAVVVVVANSGDANTAPKDMTCVVPWQAWCASEHPHACTSTCRVAKHQT